ncbi:glutamate--tRNA ligase [Paremcibacter congregatus]|uniref:Glutamate--tRNA ligase n=1 Tax=Paremcibacter congregatus TaxID=2043170 RepID=A0A2G4YUV9_9PROT|nr:glutamate--tRNA ligase [Paremcibacter congregatus]PHZ86077.1 glutamate--tRNA ligase [Paremcibacter congregatus]QDE27043.1 glutamate--tRNA ligase [Paremcibacter congregatus]
MTKAVKVRFAPSPTGLLHVGNVRTALVNWLFCRQQGGSFLLRLDDTDQARSTEAFAEAIERDLAWLGLTWDEKARQSDRIPAYEAAVEKLKAEGRLYPCYETGQELDLKRKIQLGQGKPPVYDRAGLALSEEEVKAFEAEGRNPHWRFKLDLPARVEWNDLVKGHQSFDLAALSDPILIRGDGTFLYTLPSVVDDIDFGITHIMRGEDHAANSAVQAQLFEALGGTVPAYAHFSLLTGAGGEGLSKRLGTASIQSYREEDGLEAMSINSLLARLGSSDPIEPMTSLEPLVAGFDFGKYSRSTAKFDPKDLETLNAKILHHTDFDAVADRLSDVEETLWNICRGNINKLNDIHALQKIVKGPLEPVIADKDFAEQALAVLPEAPWDATTWKAWTTAVKDKTGAKGKALFMPLRQAVTGMDHGPEMGGLLPLIDPEIVKARLQGKTA